MVSAPPRTRLVAEKYVNQRTQSFTRTHAKAMEQYVQQHGTEEGYWEDFKRRRAASEEKWRRDTAAIDNDPNMTFMQKRVAKNRLSRIFPAWDEEQERRFIEQYGDPRVVDRGNLMRLLEMHQAETFDSAIRGGNPVEVTKHNWEKKFYEALVAPRDGSVPLALDVPSVAPSTPSAGSPASFSADPEIQRMAEEWARNVCPHCKTHFKKLNRNHTDKCASRVLGAVSVEA